MARIGRFLLGAIIGGLFATAIVILLTPTPGSELRQKIVGRVDSIREEVKMAAENRRKELELELENMQHPK
jgi:gas vesicle protein